VDGALKRAAVGRTELHIVAGARNSLECPGSRPSACDAERPALQLHAAITHLHTAARIEFADEAVHEGACRLVVDLGPGVPICSDPVPCPSATTRLATSSASSWSWVTKIEGHVDLVMQRANAMCRSSLRTLASKRAERFVEQQDARLRSRAARASAMRWRWPPRAGPDSDGPASRALHEIEQFLDAGADTASLLRTLRGCTRRPNADVLEHRHVAEDRGISAGTRSRPAARRRRARARSRRRRRPRRCRASRDRAMIRSSVVLARSGRPEQRQQLAIGDLQVDVVERGERAEGFGEMPDFNAHATIFLRLVLLRHNQLLSPSS